MIVKRSQSPNSTNGTEPAKPSVFAYPASYFSVLYSELSKNKHSYDVSVEVNIILNNELLPYFPQLIFIFVDFL